MITAAKESKIKNVAEAFKSDKVDMITATSGPGIVRLSMKSGKILYLCVILLSLRDFLFLLLKIQEVRG